MSEFVRETGKMREMHKRHRVDKKKSKKVCRNLETMLTCLFSTGYFLDVTFQSMIRLVVFGYVQ